jgi:hypothetical protein
VGGGGHCEILWRVIPLQEAHDKDVGGIGGK